MADDDLIARAKEGESDAWRALYRAHAGRLVVWLGTRSGGDPAVAADDIAAEAWLVAARRIADFEGTESGFAGWLFGIARNLGTTTGRRTARRRTDPTGDERTLEQPAVDPTLAVDGDAWVRQTLAVLPPRERDVVGCIDCLGLDTAATAEALGISRTAVRVARHRGLRRLRRHAPAPADVGQAEGASDRTRSRTASGGSTERCASRS